MTDQPPSYPPPPPGGYGYNPPMPPSYGYPPPIGGYPVQQGTNGMAIAALVCSLAGPFVCGVTTILGLIFGFIGLNQIKSSGQQGRGMAIAGIIISALSIVVAVIIAVVVIMAVNEDSRRKNRYHDYDYYGAPAVAISVVPQAVAC